MAMITLTQGMVKVSEKIKGQLVEWGILESMRKYDMVSISDEAVHNKVHALMTEALEPLMDQIANFAESNGKEGALILEAMQNNINSFRLDAGSGYTAAHKASLVGTVTEQDHVIALTDFDPPKTGTTAAPKNEVSGEIEL